jgi:hypothetical protein
MFADMPPELTDKQTEALVRLLPRTIEDDRHDRYPLSPRVRVRVFSPLGFYPLHSIALPDARLLVNDELVVSCVHVEPPELHGLEHSFDFDLEFLALEETRFFAAIALAVHPDDGMAYTYPLYGHVDVDCGTDDDALIEAARELAVRPPQHVLWKRTSAPPPACGGPAYRWRESGVNIDRVLNLVCATRLNDHLLMRGLGALLRADMCWQHFEIADAAVLQLYVALEVSFQMALRHLREQGVSNPTALDAGALVDAEIFNQRHGAGNYFGDFYEDRIKTTHPSSRFGVFAAPPVSVDDYFFLRHALVEVYHWLITEQRL